MESVVGCHPLICTRQPSHRFARRTISTLCLVFALMFAVSKTYAQNGTDYAVHANIIYHFTKYINWPEDKKTGDFVIGIIGESPLFDKLKTFIANKTVGGQKIVIRKYSPSASSFNCHILFVSDDESGSLKKIASATGASAVLIVAESEGMARRGACINFAIEDERLKLEINKRNIEQRDLDIATELLNLGTVVK